MKGEFDIVSGDFEGNFFTHQKSVLTATEWSAADKNHAIHLYRGELTNVLKENDYKPEEYRNRESLLLHNVTNIQFNLKNNAGENQSKIFDFEQVLVRDAQIKESWELNGKTYGIIKGKIIGKVLQRSSNFDASNPPPPNPSEIPKIPPDDRSFSNPPIKNEITDFIHRGGGCLKGCFSNIWRLLLALLLLLLFFFLFRGCLGKIDATKDCCSERDILKSENQDLKEKLNRCDSNLIEKNNRLKELEEENEKFKELAKRRRKRGGQIGAVTFTLIWDTEDDLDLSVVDPNGAKIFHKTLNSASGGKLDIDANRCIEGLGDCNITKNPVENIFWTKTPPAGKYFIQVDFYNKLAPRSNLSKIPFFIEVLTENGVEMFRGVVTKDNPEVSFTYTLEPNQN
jgi:hypothetical protein